MIRRANRQTLFRPCRLDGRGEIGDIVAVLDPLDVPAIRGKACLAILGESQIGTAPEGDEVVGIEAGGIEADVEVDAAVTGNEIDESLAELGIAGGCFNDFEVGGGRSQVGIEEGGVVSVA